MILQNGFFESNLDPERIRRRLIALEEGKVGFYSVGLYPASLAYNCAMQTDGSRLLLAARPGRQILGAFKSEELSGWTLSTAPRWSAWVPTPRRASRCPMTWGI